MEDIQIIVVKNSFAQGKKKQTVLERFFFLLKVNTACALSVSSVIVSNVSAILQ